MNKVLINRLTSIRAIEDARICFLTGNCLITLAGWGKTVLARNHYLLYYEYFTHIIYSYIT